MDLKEIVKGITFRKDWQNRYRSFIPLFIDNAIRFDNWQDWDQQVFNEFFEKNAGQCVSSLQQGCFTNEDKNKLKQNWIQLSPSLRELALTQNEPNWDLYLKISKLIRHYTSQSMQAATNRLIASLQPQFLCTIIAEDHLKVLYKKLQLGITDGSVPKYENGNWFKSSYNILTYFKKQLNDEDSYNIMTYPWQLKEEWMPTGYNKFYDILNEVKQIVDLKYPQFKIEDISPNVSNFLWIADSKDIIGNTTAHFEINKNRNNLSVDIHFEGTEEEKNIFHQVIKKLPDKITWKKWQNSQSLTYDEIYNINDENISEKLVSSLIRLNELIGDKVRYVLENINTLISQYQVKIKEMNSKIQLLEYKKQIILQGPPGTGKTRKAKEIALKMLALNDYKELENNDQFKLIQFHPSYTYEDFVRGIVAKPSDDGEGIIYEAENKTLGKFIEDAKKNLDGLQKSSLNIYNENVFEQFRLSIILKVAEDEKFELTNNIYISEVDEKKFKYKGDNWKRHPKGLNIRYSELKKVIESNPDSRQDIVKNISLKSLTKSHATYFFELHTKYKEFYEANEKNLVYQEREKKYILIIDEINRANLSSVLGELIYALEYRDEEVEGMYEVDGSQKLALPPNLYIIGTMNTADRSVGHIDYAIRRRFAFVDVLPEKLEDTEDIFFNTPDFIEVAKLFIKVREDEVINFENAEDSDLLSNDFSSKDVALGHSYFIADKKKISEEEKDNYFKMKMKYEVVPILNEYLKDGVFNESATIKIKDIEQRFI